MLTKANIEKLIRLLLERFGDKVGRGLAVEVCRLREYLNVRNLFLPRSSPCEAKTVKPAPERGIMPGAN
jgi:hypothetical protein